MEGNHHHQDNTTPTKKMTMTFMKMNQNVQLGHHRLDEEKKGEKPNEGTKQHIYIQEDAAYIFLLTLVLVQHTEMRHYYYSSFFF